MLSCELGHLDILTNAPPLGAKLFADPFRIAPLPFLQQLSAQLNIPVPVEQYLA